MAVQKHGHCERVLPGHRGDKRRQQVCVGVHGYELRTKHDGERRREVYGEDVYESDIEQDREYSVRNGGVLLGHGRHEWFERQMHQHSELCEFIHQTRFELHVHYGMWNSDPCCEVCEKYVCVCVNKPVVQAAFSGTPGMGPRAATRTVIPLMGGEAQRHRRYDASATPL